MGYRRSERFVGQTGPLVTKSAALLGGYGGSSPREIRLLSARYDGVFCNRALSNRGYWLRVVLVAEAVATMPWGSTATDRTTSPAGSFGILMTWSGIEPPPSSEAMPPSLPKWMVITFVLVCLTVASTLARPLKSTLTASGPFAGS